MTPNELRAIEHKPTFTLDDDATTYRGTYSCTCGYYQEQTTQYSWYLKGHPLVVAAMADEPTRLMIGQAVSPGRRSEWTVWLDHLGYDRPVPYDETPSHAEARKRATAMFRASREAIEQGKRWNLDGLTRYPWMVAIHRTKARDTLWSFATKTGALSQAYMSLSKKEGKGWWVTLFEDMGGKVAYEPELALMTTLTGLIDRSNKASGTKARLSRIHEIDAVLDQMEVLRDLRSEMFNRVALG